MKVLKMWVYLVTTVDGAGDWERFEVRRDKPITSMEEIYKIESLLWTEYDEVVRVMHYTLLREEEEPI